MKYLIKKISDRYLLKESAGVEPPPAMVDNIYSIVVEIFAVLANSVVTYKISELRDLLKYDYEADFDRLNRFLKKVENDLKNSLSVDEIFIVDAGKFFETKIPVVVEVLEDGYDIKVGKYLVYSSSDIKEVLSSIKNFIFSMIKRVEDNIEKSTEKKHLVSYLLTKKKLDRIMKHKYDDEDLLYLYKYRVFDKSYEIPIDVRGWKYAHLIEEEFLDNTISLKIYSKVNIDRLGSYNFEDAELSIYLSHRGVFDKNSNFSDNNFLERNLNLIRSTIEHELIHFTQHLLNLHGWVGGAPGKEVRKDESEPETEEEEYYLAYEEFYAWIHNSIKALIFFLDKNQPKYWSLIFEYFTGIKKIPKDHFRMFGLDNYYFPSDFLITLRKKSYGKFKKAIKELLKELERRGYRIY